MASLICGDVLVCRCCEVAQYSAGVAQSRSRGEATCGGELWRLGEATESRRFGVNSGIASSRMLSTRWPMFSLDPTFCAGWPEVSAWHGGWRDLADSL